MINLSQIHDEKDLYLLLSWIIDSCDSEILHGISKFGLKKTIESLSNTKYKKRLKEIESINKLKASIKNAIKVRMQRYDSSSTFYDKKIIKQILYNNTSSAVSVFKDFLLFDDQNEFLKR